MVTWPKSKNYLNYLVCVLSDKKSKLFISIDEQRNVPGAISCQPAWTESWFNWLVVTREENRFLMLFHLNARDHNY